MKKVLVVAWREFLATAMTKAFLIGAVIIPLASMAMIPLIISLVANTKAPAIEGTLAVFDPTGKVVPEIAKRMTPEAIAKRHGEYQAHVKRAIGEKTQGIPLDAKSKAMAESSIETALGEAPRIKVETLNSDAKIEEEKATLRPQGPVPRGKGASRYEVPAPGARLALVVIDPNAVTPASGQADFGGFQLFVRPRLHDLILSDMRRVVEQSVLEARLRANGYDPAAIRALTTINAPETQEMTASGQRQSSEVFNMMIPFGFMLLLIMSTMVGSQALLTTTVEEKSTRVMEVLLSALSPMQLMAGKIIGQMAVGLTLMMLYGGLGVIGLVSFALLDLVSPVMVVYLLVFFLIAYCLIASIMAAVGSAVNDMREAQSLVGPILLVVVMMPYILWMPISRDPNSMLATVTSLIPPVSPFVMIVRLASTQPPPTWQVLLSIAVGFAAVYAFFWAAAKIFRVGVLMYGKPPNFRTLIKWVRMA